MCSSPSPRISDVRIPQLIDTHFLLFVLSRAEVVSLVFSLRPKHRLRAMVDGAGIQPRPIGPSRAHWSLPSGYEYVWTLGVENISEAAAAVVVSVAVARPDELEWALLPYSRVRVVVDPRIVFWIWYPMVCHRE